MSSTVRSYGFIAVLVSPLSEEQREVLSDQLYLAKSNLNVNYEGTLIYCDYNFNKSYAKRENVYGLFIGNNGLTEAEFIQEANGLLGIDVDTVQPYNCIWYNGSDSDINLLTKSEFLTVQRVQ